VTLATNLLSSTTAATPVSQATSSGAAAKLGADMNSFLKLLTAQLQNQDPLAPMDANAFTAQLAQYSSIEQQIATNKNMESLLDVQRANSMLSATSLVGQQVEVASDSVTLRSGTAQQMQLPALGQAGTARQALVTVTDASGTVLRQATASLGSDATSWRWDGADSRGKRVVDGTYKVAVTGIDSSGAATGPLDFTLRGTVDSVSRSGDEPRLSLGSLSVGFGNLRRL